MRVLAVATILALVLAGCSDGKGDGGSKDEGSGPDGGVPMLHGYVVDLAIRPLEGVTVKVLDNNVSVLSDAGGYYGLDDLPTEQFLVLVASKDGYIPQSKQVTLVPDVQVRLNFTLEIQPIRDPYWHPIQFEGMLGCQIAIVGPTGNSTTDCNMGLEQRNRWDFTVDGDLAGAVVEVYWDFRTEVGKSLGIRLETLELGQLNVVLGEVVGESPLRITVPESAARKLFPSGGYLRLTVQAASDATQNEAGVGESVVVQQAFQAFASLFYVETPACFASHTMEDPCPPT
ncbi:MAG: carboxypeptidase-like regulatory domain-containing protein [Candidatus Thermoplasmatota archaeon]